MVTMATTKTKLILSTAGLLLGAAPATATVLGDHSQSAGSISKQTYRGRAHPRGRNRRCRPSPASSLRWQDDDNERDGGNRGQHRRTRCTPSATTTTAPTTTTAASTTTTTAASTTTTTTAPTTTTTTAPTTTTAASTTTTAASTTTTAASTTTTAASTTTTVPKPNVTVGATFSVLGVGNPIQLDVTYAAGPVAVNKANILVHIDGHWPNVPKVGASGAFTCTPAEIASAPADFTCTGDLAANAKGTITITTVSSIAAGDVGQTATAKVTATPGNVATATGTYK
jgi:hypothetical protein